MTTAYVLKTGCQNGYNRGKRDKDKSLRSMCKVGKKLRKGQITTTLYTYAHGHTRANACTHTI